MKNKKEKKHPERNHGKQHHQKMKPYIVMQYLLKHSDENNPITAEKIASELKVKYDIYAERRSIYRDIDEINKAIIMLENDCDIYEAGEILEGDEEGNDKLIRKNKYGFYARPREYDETDIRLLAECIYSAKFLDKTQTNILINLVCDMVNKRQAEKIKHSVLLTDRVRTKNSQTIYNIATINEAMSKELSDKRHIPEKISFKYLKHTIRDTNNQVERRHGETYITNPYALLINDGNYYLLAFDEKKKKFISYRVDRMKDVKLTGEKRVGDKEFSDIDLKDYTKRVFSMFSGERKRVVLQFTNHLLDTVIDRFGTKDVLYLSSGKKYFTVNATVEISRQFYGWLLGFDKEAKIISPNDVIEDFRRYIDGISQMYV